MVAAVPALFLAIVFLWPRGDRDRGRRVQASLLMGMSLAWVLLPHSVLDFRMHGISPIATGYPGCQVMALAGFPVQQISAHGGGGWWLATRIQPAGRSARSPSQLRRVVTWVLGSDGASSSAAVGPSSSGSVCCLPARVSLRVRDDGPLVGLVLRSQRAYLAAQLVGSGGEPRRTKPSREPKPSRRGSRVIDRDVGRTSGESISAAESQGPHSLQVGRRCRSLLHGREVVLLPGSAIRGESVAIR